MYAPLDCFPFIAFYISRPSSLRPAKVAFQSELIVTLKRTIQFPFPHSFCIAVRNFKRDYLESLRMYIHCFNTKQTMCARSVALRRRQKGRSSNDDDGINWGTGHSPSRPERHSLHFWRRPSQLYSSGSFFLTVAASLLLISHRCSARADHGYGSKGDPKGVRPIAWSRTFQFSP